EFTEFAPQKRLIELLRRRGRHHGRMMPLLPNVAASRLVREPLGRVAPLRRLRLRARRCLLFLRRRRLNLVSERRGSALRRSCCQFFGMRPQLSIEFSLALALVLGSVLLSLVLL